MSENQNKSLSLKEFNQMSKEDKDLLIVNIYKNQGTISKIRNQEFFNAILNQEPPQAWIKSHPSISNFNYLPIDKVEFLLRLIFKKYKIEVLREGTSFNGVYVVVRVHYFNGFSDEWDYHDGIGAADLQTKKGSDPSNLFNINKGAIQMAFPIAKSLAIKDACDHLGKLFGSDLNRKDTLTHRVDDKIINHPFDEIIEEDEAR